MASWSKCPPDSFPEPLTGGKTCTSCRLVCDPVYETPELCSRYCPNHLELITMSTVTGMEHSAHKGYIIAIGLLSVISMIAIIAFIRIYTKRKMCIKSIQACYSSRTERSKLNRSSDAEGTRMLEVWSEATVNRTSEKSSEEVGSEATVNRTSEMNASGSDSIRSSNEGKLSAASTNSKQSYVTAASTFRQQSPTKSDSLSSCMTTTPDMSKPFDMTTKNSRQLDMTETRCQRSIVTERTVMSSRFELSLRSTDDGSSVLSRRDTNEAGTIPNRESQWNDVLRAYDVINMNIHNLPWIDGCILGNDRMKVIVNESRDQPEIDNHRRYLAELMPASIRSDVLEITRFYPSFELTCGRYGTGSVLANDKGQLARIIMLGNDPLCNKAVVLTVAHLVQKGEKCELYCSSDEKRIHTMPARCCSHIHTLGEGRVMEARRRLCDLALVRLADFVPDSRVYQYVLKERSFDLQLDPPTSDLHLPSIQPGRKLLVFAGEDGRPTSGWVDRDEAILTCIVSGDRKARQKINLIQIHSPEVCSESSGLGLVLSGSAVAFHPDDLDHASTNCVRVEAFAMVIGVNIKKPNILCALPLWDQMEELFAEDKSLAYLKPCVKVSGFQSLDSGYYSQNYHQLSQSDERASPI